MTLAGWCQAYIYMPLIGRTRNPYLASYGSFVTMGLWHAGSVAWIGWGLYHATGVVSYVAWTRLKRRKKWKALDRSGLSWIGWSLTLLFVSAGGAFTSMHDRGTGYDILRILAKLLFFENG